MTHCLALYLEQETASIRSHRASLIPQEPLPSDPDVIHVVIRMPSGERLERRFRGSDKLEVFMGGGGGGRGESRKSDGGKYFL